MTDFQRRICFTLAALAAYRLGTHIPLPGIDIDFLTSLHRTADPLVQYNDEQLNANLLASFSVFALGVVPYLTAAILMRLASAISPRLRSLERRSPADRQRIVRATRLLAMLIAALQAVGLAIGMESLAFSVSSPGLTFRFGAAVTMTAGFVVIMWLSDQISRRGIGNGVALILLAGIVTDIPGILALLVELTNTRTLTLGVAISLLLFSVAVVAGIVFIERSVRHVWVLYPKQEIGQRTFGGQYASIPLKLNNGGFIPAFIVGWLLTHLFALATYIQFSGGGYTIEDWLRWGWPEHPVYLSVSAVLIVAMAYIYAVALLDPGDFARHLQERGAVALHAKPGAETERAFRRLLRGLSLFGGVYLAVIYLLPEILYALMPVLPGPIGGIGFLIATVVAMDTLADLAHRWNLDYGSKPVSEEFGDAVAIAMEIPDQPRVRAKGPNEAGR